MKSSFSSRLSGFAINASKRVRRALPSETVVPDVPMQSAEENPTPKDYVYGRISSPPKPGTDLPAVKSFASQLGAVTSILVANGITSDGIVARFDRCTAFTASTDDQLGLLEILALIQPGDRLHFIADRLHRHFEVATELIKELNNRGIAAYVHGMAGAPMQCIADGGRPQDILRGTTALPPSEALELYLDYLQNAAWPKSQQQAEYGRTHAIIRDIVNWDVGDLEVYTSFFKTVFGGKPVVLFNRISAPSQRNGASSYELRQAFYALTGRTDARLIEEVESALYSTYVDHHLWKIRHTFTSGTVIFLKSPDRFSRTPGVAAELQFNLLRYHQVSIVFLTI